MKSDGVERQNILFFVPNHGVFIDYLHFLPQPLRFTDKEVNKLSLADLRSDSKKEDEFLGERLPSLLADRVVGLDEDLRSTPLLVMMVAVKISKDYVH